ncbi:2-C-methyl-D-erythritol 4-phosphate cytidylyltransferase [Nigerium massiliense]|uniref:2-C-methyl-D-erythritol 4-phosphate cytidylyltransferase n=1 Tax=Nigerium massiliense TaxID=1522317 RepID=UPI00058ABD89|nr:2-C-methyl-D-erythritol 4-phosphate cytidylyltransferase [Nigerium massiliense]
MPSISISSGPVVAIVVAAGSGVRLGGDVPKALRTVGGLPLVVRSVRQLAAGGCAAAIVVVAEPAVESFERVLADAPIPVRIVTGGAERQDSVRNGLLALQGDEELSAAEIVLVHDAARALVPVRVVEDVVAAVRGGAPAVTPITEVVDSIRQLTEVGSAVIDRSTLRAVQTPQGFERDALLEAHALIQENRVPVTDDIAAYEFAGGVATLVDGDRLAFKITTEFDLVIAEAIASADRS